MIDMPDLPPAVPKPCNDCPWRRNAAPGWLGPHTAEEWIKLAHTEAPIACHQTIPEGVGEASWDTPNLRQCAGAAIYRVHAVKYMRNPTDAQHGAQADREHVFSDILGRDFIAYHTRAADSEQQLSIRKRPCGDYLERAVGDGRCSTCHWHYEQHDAQR